MISWPYDVQFIPSSIPHESLSASDRDELESYLVGCGCRPYLTEFKESCSSSNCECLSRAAPAYDSSGLLKPEYYCGKGPPIIECGQLCGCTVDTSSLEDDSEFSEKFQPESKCFPTPCCNRTVGYSADIYRFHSEHPSIQLEFTGYYQMWKFLQVFATAEKGFGLRCSVTLPAGAFVCEYAGELVSLEEAQKRTEEHSDTYLFAIRESSETSVTTTCIDARYKGNWGRMINHACDPNLIMLPVRIDTIIPRLCFFAKKDVNAGEELTVDYDQGNDVKKGLLVDASVAKRDGSSFSTKKCVCGSGCCRGFLPFNGNLFL